MTLSERLQLWHSGLPILDLNLLQDVCRHAKKRAFAATLSIFVGLPGIALSQDSLGLARSGDVEALRLALPKGSNPESKTLVRPIYFAAQRGHADVVAHLLEAGAPPNAMTDFGSALQIAARNNHVDIVRMLLDQGADPNTRGGDFGNAPIHDAAERGAMDTARILLEHGADVNLQRGAGDQPAIHLAVRRGRSEMAAFLLANGASPLLPEPVTEGEFEVTDTAIGRARAEECLYCHSLEEGDMPSTKFAGPDLAGFVGREIAIRDYFKYSGAMQAKKGTWTLEELNRFIADPTGFVPGTTMERGAVPDRAERLAVIKYLMIAADSQQ